MTNEHLMESKVNSGPDAYCAFVQCFHGMTLTRPLTMIIALHRPGLSITSIEETCIKSTERELKKSLLPTIS